MKESKYNFFFEAEDGAALAFNSMTCAFAEIDEDEYERVKKILKKPDDEPEDEKGKELKNQLQYGGFLIDDKADELRELKVSNRTDRFRTNELNLTIAPTTECNFRCSYCYEEHLKQRMSEEVQDNLIKFAESRAGSLETLYITWFGGEPTMCMDIVERLSKAFQEICAEKDVNYSAYLVSNGYALDEKKAKKLKELSVGRIQITLDGPKDIHDKRRPLVKGKGTFDRIVENIKNIREIIPVDIRVNVDRENAERSFEVLDMLESEGLKSKVNAYFAQVSASTEVCANIAESCYSSQEYSELEAEFYKMAMDRGFHVAKYPYRINGAYCTADRASGLVIAPTGAIYKCWHEMTADPSEASGHLLEQGKPFHTYNFQNWMKWDPFEKPLCLKCNILPLCMGGCPHSAMKEKDKGSCQHWKYNIIDYLKAYYLGYKKGSLPQL